MKRFPRLLSMLFLALALVVGCGGDDAGQEVGAESPDRAGPDAVPADLGLTVQGFSRPESALHDSAADVYLVSNINGDGAAEDDNGFVSRVSPDGEVLDLRWIDGASADVTLHAPRGMGIRGDTLFVADLTAVRLFDRRSGAPIASWNVDGAHLLNDIAVASNGTVYVSDMGVRFEGGERVDTGDSAIHAFSSDGSRRTLDTGDLTAINGLATTAGRLYGVTNGTGRVFVIEDGTLSELPELPGLALDGIVWTDRGLLISDWDTEAVYLLRDNGSISIVARNVTSPADIGLDRGRGRVLIPSMVDGLLMLAPLGGSAAANTAGQS